MYFFIECSWQIKKSISNQISLLVVSLSLSTKSKMFLMWLSRFELWDPTQTGSGSVLINGKCSLFPKIGKFKLWFLQYNLTFFIPGVEFFIGPIDYLILSSNHGFWGFGRFNFWKIGIFFSVCVSIVQHRRPSCLTSIFYSFCLFKKKFVSLHFYCTSNENQTWKSRFF